MSSAESLADASVEPSKAVGFDRLNQRQAQPTCSAFLKRYRSGTLGQVKPDAMPQADCESYGQSRHE
jgi:hypothetical protein